MTPAGEDDSGGPSHPADADQPTRVSNADHLPPRGFCRTR